ncbi:branched-chain amino acid transport system II carrier protein [Cytobacillus firmus]|uniref:branched-chain amino acid transport system II carrier protein n=1 Tax=Cytobacillus firmus TaxID=1399 RepID=UPI003B75C66F
MFWYIKTLDLKPSKLILNHQSQQYELGFMQMYSAEGLLSLFLFSAVFFCLTCILSINPIRIIDYIGQFLTPALLGVLAILLISLFYTSFRKVPANPFLKVAGSLFHNGCSPFFCLWDVFNNGLIKE